LLDQAFIVNPTLTDMEDRVGHSQIMCLQIINDNWIT